MLRKITHNSQPAAISGKLLQYIAGKLRTKVKKRYRQVMLVQDNAIGSLVLAVHQQLHSILSGFNDSIMRCYVGDLLVVGSGEEGDLHYVWISTD